jgi:hypothetical protein
MALVAMEVVALKVEMVIVRKGDYAMVDCLD